MLNYNSLEPAYRESLEETSQKKYPYNKYYDFKDEDSSGRKYIRQEFNLKQNNPHFLNLHNQSQHYTLSNKEVQGKISKKRKANNTKKYQNKSIASERAIKNKSCNQSMHSISNRNQHNNSIKWGKQDEVNDQLKHYKKLCLQMRKKNNDLEKQLYECKQDNRKSILQLNHRVQKMNQKYQDKKQSIDACKVDKILTSLKTIKGNLRKNPQQNSHTKFYKFFIESLGILYPDGQAPKKLSTVQIQVLWKQILQFLITNDFKPQKCKSNSRIR